MMKSTQFPYPPPDLMQRVGYLDSSALEDAYEEIGRAIRGHIEGVLPKSWSWQGARVLDFGSGAGRVLRHFAGEVNHAEFWGCDIDVRSIEWVEENLNPPFRAVVCNEEPGLPQFEDGFFTLIYAASVFTHLTEHATGWLLELHRILTDGGLLWLSFLGAGMIHVMNEPWEEDRIGFNATGHGASWDCGGPTTFISSWWMREHWGRAFEIVELREFTQPGAHDLALLRKRSGHFSVADIEQVNADDPREIRALQHNITQLSNQLKNLNTHISNLNRQVPIELARCDALAREHKTLNEQNTSLATENARLAKEIDRLAIELNARNNT
jgi:SAM-dependent methyltransferase